MLYVPSATNVGRLVCVAGHGDYVRQQAAGPSACGDLQQAHAIRGMQAVLASCSGLYDTQCTHLAPNGSGLFGVLCVGCHGPPIDAVCAFVQCEPYRFDCKHASQCCFVWLPSQQPSRASWLAAVLSSHLFSLPPRVRTMRYLDICGSTCMLVQFNMYVRMVGACQYSMESSSKGLLCVCLVPGQTFWLHWAVLCVALLNSHLCSRLATLNVFRCAASGCGVIVVAVGVRAAMHTLHTQKHIPDDSCL